MGKSKQNARNQLDWFLFRNVHNAFVTDESKWAVTYEGDNYVVWDKEKDKFHHFRVTIEDYEWDSTQAREDQEWGADW